MRKIAANLIITNTGEKLKNGIIRLNDENEIIEVIDTKGRLLENEKLEFYNGVIVPGFVNAHCHLELAHMKNILTKGRGLPSFIKEIISKRFTSLNIQDLIKQSDLQMNTEGIVACGDIANTADTIETKQQSKIYYYTFAEVFTIGEETEETAFARGKKLISKYKSADLNATIVPHAPYSVPKKLYTKIQENKYENDKIISIHNQETKSENQLFLEKKGVLHDILSYKATNYLGFEFIGKNSLQTTLHYLSPKNNTLLIHNTYTNEDDINFAEHFSENIYWVFCPKSNLQIENTLPNIPLFFSKNLKICIGTDSLASNDKLSILDEIKTIQLNFPEISLEKLIFSATLQGARALKIDTKYGSIKVGKKPGLNLLTNLDLETLKLTTDTKIKALL